jgi:hypothetical protein
MKYKSYVLKNIAYFSQSSSSSHGFYSVQLHSSGLDIKSIREWLMEKKTLHSRYNK